MRTYRSADGNNFSDGDRCYILLISYFKNKCSAVDCTKYILVGRIDLKIINKCILNFVLNLF